MSETLDIACTILRLNGYDISTYKNDGNEFFQIIGENFPGKSKNASATRHAVCEFQEKHGLYFQLFIPRKIDSSVTVTDPKDNFERDINIMKRKGVTPTPRDIFAAAELLEHCIYVFEFTGNSDHDVDSFHGVVYAPVIKQELPSKTFATMLLMTLDPNTHQPSFARIVTRTDGDTVVPYPAPIYNVEHKNCYESRFRNTFQEMCTFSPPGQQTDKKDFFRRLSIEMYGTDQYRDMVKKVVCYFLEEDDNLDVVSRLMDDYREDTTLDERRTQVTDHVKKVRVSTKLPTQVEIFAAASLFNVNIFVDQNCADVWEMFCPLGDTYATTFDSPVALKRQAVDTYLPYVTNARSCACRQRSINVKGKIVAVKEDIYRALGKSSLLHFSFVDAKIVFSLY